VCLIIARALNEQIDARAWVGAFRDLLSARLVVEIALYQPRSARILFDLGKQIGDFEWLDEFSGRFLEYIMLEMPRSAIFGSGVPPTDWIRLLRDVGRGLSPLLTRRIVPEFFERMFHPRQLMELIERNPEAALAYLQVLRELVRGEFFGHIERELGPQFFERMFHPRQLMELTERNPEAALAYLQVLRELGGGEHFGHFVKRVPGPEFFERMFRPRQLMELTERNPEAALVYLQVLRELGGGQYFGRFVERELGHEFFTTVWSIDIVSRYPVPNGYGDRKATAMGSAGRTGEKLRTSLSAVRHLSTDATEMG
jgi:hypothetical protein